MGRTNWKFYQLNNFVEDIVNQFSFTIFLREEHISRTDKLQKYRKYENGNEVKEELASMLDNFIKKYESNQYVLSTNLVKSKSEGLSNYTINSINLYK